MDKSEDTTLALVVKSGGCSHDRPASSPWRELFFVLDFLSVSATLESKRKELVPEK